MIPNGRLCKALLDSITDRAHIIETGTESYEVHRVVVAILSLILSGTPLKPHSGIFVTFRQ